jgi:hypothetical protein
LGWGGILRDCHSEAIEECHSDGNSNTKPNQGRICCIVTECLKTILNMAIWAEFLLLICYIFALNDLEYR